MAFSLSALAPNSIPKTNSIDSETRVRVSVLKQAIVNPVHVKLYGKSCSSSISSSSIRGSLTRLNAGFHEIEPDIDEDPTDRWETPTVGPEDFEYGKWDGYHTYVEGEDTGTMWEALSAEYTACEPPTGFQGIMSWLFLPAIAAGMYFNAPGEYLFIGAGLFTIIFCIIEMDKPAKPHNFEPHIYNMERGARDKLINDFNTLTVWEFNDKYGDLWDITLKTDGIMKK